MSGLESATAKVSLDEKDDVLKETTNINTEIEPPSEVAGFNPQAKGWVKPTRYDYEIYNRNAYTTGPEGAAEANRVTPGNEMGLWAANAERYEWKEEYGDVAPCNTDLEKMLFQNEFRTRLGPSILK